MKKRFAALTVYLLVAAMLAGCASSAEGGAPAEPAAGDGASSVAADAGEPAGQTAPLKYYCRTNAERESKPDNQQVLAYIEEQTGIDMEITALAQETFKEKIDLMIASNEVFDGMNLVGYGETYTELSQKGAIQPINELLDQYGPNVKRVMEEGLFSATDAEGQIWSIPRAERFPEGYVPVIRRDWLEQLGMEMPTTMAELEAFFEAVKTTDLNGNGQNDEIPYLPNMLMYGLSNFIPYYIPVKDGNLTSTGFANLTNTKAMRYMAEDGTIRSVLSHPDMIGLITKLNEWYTKGYMPQDIHLLRTAQLTDIRTTGTVGMLGGWYSDGNAPIMNYNETSGSSASYVPIPPLTDAPSGRSMWPSNPTYAPQILFMSNAENPEALMRYFDWLCAEPVNTAVAQFGLEGTHWDWVAGAENTLELTAKSTDYLEFYSLANLWWDGLMPTIQVPPENAAEFMREEQMQAIRGFEMNYPFDSHIPYAYEGTDAEMLTADGGTLMEEAITKMIIGETPLTDWESVVASYNAIEGDILSAVWTEQYNAFVG